jgi:hypothetical protein
VDLADRILAEKGEEIWAAVPMFEETYQVSSWGRLWRIRTVKSFKAGALSNAQPRSDGYIPVTLRQHGRSRQCLLHQLVLEAFRGPCPAGMEVNHRHPDGDKSRNWLSNLEYVTSAVNNADQRLHRPVKYLIGDRHPKSKIPESAIQSIKTRISAGERLQAIADDYSVGYGTIHAIATGRSRRDQNYQPEH